MLRGIRWILIVAALGGCAGTDTSDALSTVLREGEARLVRGDVVGARAAFMAATERDARCFVGWIGLSRSLAASGDVDGAERALSRGLAVSPESADALDLSGRTALELAKVLPVTRRKTLALLAESLLDRAAAADPELPRLAYHRGLAAWWAGNYGAARAAFDDAAKQGFDARVEEARRAMVAEISGLATRPSGGGSH